MVADPNVKASQTAMHFEQRFNVALSRARDRIFLVRSVREEELNPNDLKARVIRHFREPMASAAAPSADLEAACESDFERALLRRLTKRGYRVRPQVGALGFRIDMVVEGANDRRLAIECDGDRYHGPERWADDMRRQRTLERVGWRFWRCWASSFALDPDGCEADLVATLDRLGIEPLGADAPAPLYTRHRTATSASSSTPAPRRHPAKEAAVGMSLGDRAALRFLDDDKVVTVTLDGARHDPANGLAGADTPLGRALLGLGDEDEGAYAEDGRERRFLVMRVETSRAVAASGQAR